MQRQIALARLRAATLVLAFATACSDHSMNAPTLRLGELAFSASVVGTTVSTLVVTVTAADITTPIVFNLQETGGVATGTLRIPPGDARTITVQAFDNLQQLTHEGSKTLNIVPGPNPPVSIPVISRAGQLPITAILGPVQVQISSAMTVLYPGEAVQLHSTITAPNGDLITGQPMWSSSNATVATVDPNGLVSAAAGGDATISATYEGVAFNMRMTVVKFTAVSGGGRNTCAVSAGTIGYCWGQNRGTLGVGNADMVVYAFPRRVISSVSLNAVVASSAWGFGNSGYGHTCALGLEGSAYCWGANVVGELGIGATWEGYTPLAVAGGLHFRSLSVGSHFSCGVTADNLAYCWGDNPVGQLGLGYAGGWQYGPQLVSGGLRFQKVATGDQHACGVTTTGQGYCWGWNYAGQLGLGFVNPAVASPSLVAGGLAFRDISAGYDHSCGLTTGGQAYCWGANDHGGQLGDGSGSIRHEVPVAVGGGLSFTSIYSGDFFSCGQTTAGKLYCWGQNDYGQYGNGGVTSSGVPQPAGSDLAFAQVTTGSSHMCGIDGTGTLYCWGRNDWGQLGIGSASVPVTTPTRVSRPAGD